jgi:hypothetical protein
MMKIIFIFLSTLISIVNVIGQIPNDSIYASWWKNKNSSIFSSINTGKFYGNTYGYLQVERNDKTLVLDFQSTNTVLDIEIDSFEVYDNSTKKYSTTTTSGKTKLTYETYALGNILTIDLNSEQYMIGSTDGASDMPILGMTFNYCNEPNIEYLSLFVTKLLELTTTRQLMREKEINYLEAEKISRNVKLLPGSTLIFTIRK